MHPIKAGDNEDEFAPNTTGDFSGRDMYEYYKLAWSAYAIGFSDYNETTHMGTLTLWYNYQPWEGEKYSDGNSTILMDGVSTFRFRSIGSVIEVQVCTKSNLIQGDEYSICKEKTVL